MILSSLYRRGQATTLTWFSATLVIAFILLIFLASSAYLASQRVVPVVGSGKSTIRLEGTPFSSESLESQRLLLVLLEDPVSFQGTIVSLRDLLQWRAISDDAIQGTLSSLIDEHSAHFLAELPVSERGCYSFSYALVEHPSDESGKQAHFILSVQQRLMEVTLKYDC